MSDQNPPPPPPPSGPFPPQGGQPPYGYGQPMMPPKKSNTARNIIIGVILVMILFCGGCFAIVGLGANEVAKETDKTLKEIDESLNAEPTPEKDTETKKAEEPKEDDPEPKAEWKTVAKLSGNTNKSGPDFHLNGCDTRMKYTVDGGDMVVVAFYVMESGTKLLEDGGIPVASPSESGPGETVIREDEGEYYIETMAANAKWSVQVQEKC